jgi:hypothetical protein
VSESASAETLAKMAAKIRNLLARAEDPRLEHEEERQAFFNKAEELRRKYKIVEEELIATDQFSADVMVTKITISKWNSDFLYDHMRMWASVAAFTGILYKTDYVGYDLVVTVVGYGSDIQHAEGLYQAAWLMMAGKLEPKVDPKLSDAENVYALRGAGIERNRIAQMLWGADLGKAGHAAHAKVGKLYAEACRARGEDPVVAGRGVNKKVYRELYGEEFANRFANRLRLAKDAADSVGGTLVLAGREQRVKEAFWKEFPEEHPDAKAAARAAAAARVAEEEAKTPGKKVARREAKWTKRDQDAWERRHFSAAAVAGKAAGRDAADRVEIARTSQRAQRIEEATPAQPNGIALGN